MVTNADSRSLVRLGVMKGPDWRPQSVTRRLVWNPTPTTVEVCIAHLELGKPVVRLVRGPKGGYTGSTFMVVDELMDIKRCIRALQLAERIASATLHVGEFYEWNMFEGGTYE